MGHNGDHDRDQLPAYSSLLITVHHRQGTPLYSEARAEC